MHFLAHLKRVLGRGVALSGYQLDAAVAGEDGVGADRRWEHELDLEQLLVELKKLFVEFADAEMQCVGDLEKICSENISA